MNNEQDQQMSLFSPRIEERQGIIIYHETTATYPYDQYFVAHCWLWFLFFASLVSQDFVTRRYRSQLIPYVLDGLRVFDTKWLRCALLNQGTERRESMADHTGGLMRTTLRHPARHVIKWSTFRIQCERDAAKKKSSERQET